MRRAVVVALAATLVATAAATATAARAQDNPLDHAKRAAREQSFEARVRVEWVDRSGRHQADLEVASTAGVMRVVGPRQETVIAAPDARFLLDQAGWSLLWPSGAAGHTDNAPMAGKYEVAAGPGESAAGRPTVEIVIRERGVLIERMAVDEATGLVLRRRLYDGGGNVVRLVEVEDLRVGSTRTPTTTPSPDKTKDTPKSKGTPRALADGRVPAPFAAPLRLDGEYQRVGAYQRGGTVHMLYSDGLHALSVFAQAGRLAQGDLPAGGERVAVGKGTGVRYSWPGGDVVMWESGGIVYTAVGDAPLADVTLAAASMPGGRRLPVDDRLRRACRRLVETVTGGV
jgi:negative regulator of sigma E activity